MSLRMSKLKAAKALVSSYFITKYGLNYRFGVFYSEGTQDNKHEDQFLKIELEIPEKDWDKLVDDIKTYLISVDPIYREIKIIAKKLIPPRYVKKKKERDAGTK